MNQQGKDIMDRKSTMILNIAIGLLLGLFIAGQFAFKNNMNDKEPVAKYYTPPLPRELSFAGENVPLQRWEVKERFDREYLFNYYNQANVFFLMKLANRYFPIISQRLKANGIPDDFKYLCVAESNLLSGARSGVGATGFWQFMKDTAPGYNLEVNDTVDDRYDILKSTDAASQYLKSAYQKFGNWTAAAASYNCGQGGYNSQVTFQGTTNYYDLQLPEETNRYLFRILALKQLLENADSLGFILNEDDKYPPLASKAVTVTTTIPNLATFALDNGTTYKMLRLLNPWIRGRSLPVPLGKSYVIQLPASN
ncbi:MAG: lytic transglycosylase domain-containing protein [Chitinophagaceae bacterium]